VNKVTVGFLSVFVTGVCQFSFALDQVVESLDAPPFQITITQRIDDEGFSPYVLKVTNNSEVVYQTEDFIVELFSNWDGKDLDFPEDFDTDGRPNVIIKSYSGGAHCCDTYFFIELSDPISVQELHTGNAGLQWLGDIDKDGRDEFLTQDDCFSYWNECYAGSPQPEVVLEYGKDDRVVVDPTAMKKVPPAQKELGIWAHELNIKIRELYMRCLRSTPRNQVENTMASNGENLPTEMWGVMLDLLYTGNEKEAWAFFNQCWPDNIPGKEDFKKEFLEQLETSPFWKEFQKQQGAKDAVI
jgi:hypothetical protein